MQLTLFETVKPKQRRRDLPPTDPHVEARDVRRLTGQNLAILERLRQGPASNVELVKLAMRLGARVRDLRLAGYTISVERQDGGVHLYKLIGEQQ